jgi:hypothetical protein
MTNMLIDLAAVLACFAYLAALILRHELRERGYRA